MASNMACVAQKAAPALRGGLSAIDQWRNAITGDAPKAFARLQAAYLENWPSQGELIFTGACTFKCKHCIYAPSFARFNQGLTVDDWDTILADLARGLHIGTFVYGGRSVSEEGLEVLSRLRRSRPAAQVGLIDNGISMLPLREKIFDVAADWIDSSLDGLEADHDRQRGKAGSFRAGLEGAQWLVENGAAPKVNILTCLTAINRSSVIPMIRDLNALGFRNFFVTPVTIVDGVGPAPELRLGAEEFGEFVEQLRDAVSGLEDAWVEVTIYGAEYAKFLAQRVPAIWQGMTSDRDGLAWHESCSATNSDFFVRYYPISLTGTRELIVNTNGDLIVPQSMARGKVETDDIVGSLLTSSARELVQMLPESPRFGFYGKELVRERNLLRRYL